MLFKLNFSLLFKTYYNYMKTLDLIELSFLKTSMHELLSYFAKT